MFCIIDDYRIFLLPQNSSVAQLVRAVHDVRRD